MFQIIIFDHAFMRSAISSRLTLLPIPIGVIIKSSVPLFSLSLVVIPLAVAIILRKLRHYKVPTPSLVSWICITLCSSWSFSSLHKSFNVDKKSPYISYNLLLPIIISDKLLNSNKIMPGTYHRVFSLSDKPVTSALAPIILKPQL